MLITNFASGELSENLFGRIDIPQYYSGASYLENFDVIPTGGIKNRGGMERITELEGDGRLISFVVNRDEGYLLYLTPGNITVFRLEGEEITRHNIFTADEDIPLYKTFSEINEVQYAQNFDTMILCHENYRPLEVNLINGELEIKPLEISFQKTVVAGKGTEEDAFAYRKDDETYKQGWLTKEGYYPASVTFFNGRLVFANTKNEHQRLFVSSIKKAGEKYNFATTKVFLTEKKEYIAVYGSVDADAPAKNVIWIEYNEGIKFIKPLEDYFIETPFFPPETKIVGLQGNKLVVSKGASLVEITTQIKNDLDNIERLSNELDNLNSTEYLVAETGHYMEPPVGQPFLTITYKYVTAGATKIKLRAHTPNITDAPNSLQIFNYTKYLTLPENGKAVQEYENNPRYYYNFIKGFVSGYGTKIDENNLEIVAANLKNNSFSTMKYRFISGDVDETYYHFGPEIKRIIYRRYGNAHDVYIPFYTREIIVDDYPTPDCGFTFEIASDMNDAIRWIAVNKGLIIGTETGEWIIPPDVHATNIQANLNSRYGSDKIQGTAAGDATVFFQTGKKSLVEYYIPQQDNNFRANNMAMLASQMLSESAARDFDYISSPYTKLLITREDGTVVTLLYERSTGTFAWGRLSTNAGKIRSLAVLPGRDGYDDTYMIVERTNGFYLEKMREEFEAYLDSYKQWDGDRSAYTDEAVIYDKEENKAYKLTEALPEASQKRFIGYPYTSRIKSMPVLSNKEMKPVIIKNLLIRFVDSYEPKVKSSPNEHTDTFFFEKAPFTGVRKVMFSGVWDRDAMFEFIHDRPNKCMILAINTEVN